MWACSFPDSRTWQADIDCSPHDDAAHDTRGAVFGMIARQEGITNID